MVSGCHGIHRYLSVILKIIYKTSSPPSFLLFFLSYAAFNLHARPLRTRVYRRRVILMRNKETRFKANKKPLLWQDTF
jgi:hypothetical protein